MRLEPLPELLCREVVELLTEYLSGSLGVEEQARLLEHLKDCEPCTAHLAQLKASIAHTASLKDAPAAPVAASLLDAFRARSRR